MGRTHAFDACSGGMAACYGMACPLDDLAIPVPGENHAFNADTSSLADFVPKGKLRRIDHYSRMALLACGRAIKDVAPSLFPRERTGVILATGYGALSSTFSFLDSYIEKGDKLAFPTHFSNSVHNAAAAHISICYNIKGPSLTVSQLDMSFFSALITAGSWLETWKTDAVLVGTADTYCKVMGYCINEFSIPRKRTPYSFGEGAAFFLVSRETHTRPRYGYIDQITMGQSREMEIPLDVDIIFTPSSIDFCDATPGELRVGHVRELKVRRHGFSPTDNSMDAAYALEGRQRTCCIKRGQNGAWGKLMITPADGGKNDEQSC